MFSGLGAHDRGGQGSSVAPTGHCGLGVPATAKGADASTAVAGLLTCCKWARDVRVESN